MNGIPVLMYHALEDETHPAGAKDAGEQLYVLHVKQFREQMEYLQREGYRTFLLEELHSLDVWPEKSVVLTFDDGHESNFTLALPILQEFGFKAHFFITTGWIGTPHFMTEEQIRELRRAGMSIGSHGTSHSFFTDLSASALCDELTESIKILSHIVGHAVKSFSAPGGRINGKIASVANNIGCVQICISLPRYYYRKDSFKCVPRFAIRHNDSLNKFKSIIYSSRFKLLYTLLHTYALNMAKTILGNNVYDKARHVLIGLIDR